MASTSSSRHAPLASTPARGAPLHTSGHTAPAGADPYRDFVAAPLKLFETAARLKSKPAYWVRDVDGWQATSWQDYASQVRAAAEALMALGVARGDAVAILSFNCPAWSVTAFAAMAIGAVPVGIYWTSASADIHYILNHCKAPLLLVEDDASMARVCAIGDQLMHLRTVVQIRGETSPGLRGKQVLRWASFMTLGDILPAHSATAAQALALKARMEGISPSDTGALIYTSGTTGPSKAVVLSHGNLWWVATTLRTLFDSNENDRVISYLPLAHIAELMGSLHNQAHIGFAVYFARSIDQLSEHLKEVRPTIFFGVPRVWEKMQAAIEAKLQTATGLKAQMAHWALDVGQRWHAQEMAGHEPGAWLSLQRQLAQRLVYGKVKAALGFDRARLLISGAAPISPHSLRFFTGLDLPVRELYGQSEACGPSTFNLPGATRVGSVGQPMPGTEVGVAEDGELMVRGPHIFQGYQGQIAETAQTMCGDWLLSGDLGHIDEDGYVYITGRKKDLIITSGGKNISPANIEAALMDSHLIEHAVVCGDGRHFLSALLTLEAPALAALAQASGLSGLSQGALLSHPQVLQSVQDVVNAVNAQQAKVAHIRKFALLPEPLTIEGGELTPTLKVKRKVVLARQQALIDALYAN
jgi:long-chain acyl-CoA synthetase